MARHAADPVSGPPTSGPPAGKPPSRARGAAQGAVAGGRAGPAGAGIGAVLGARSAARARRAYHAPGRAHKTLVAEFGICALVTALSPLSAKYDLEPPAVFVKRLSGVAFTFVILGMVASVHDQAARLAAALGGLVTLAIVISHGDVLVTLATRLGSVDLGPAGPDPVGEHAPQQVPSPLADQHGGPLG